MIIDLKDLFTLTVDDIRKKLESKTTYNLLRACGLVRQLIQEDTNLLIAINQGLQQKVKFVIPDIASGDPMYDVSHAFGYLVWVTVDPDSPIFEKSKEVDRKQFLATKVLRYYQQVFSVEDVIQVASNYYGGIHYKKPYPNAAKYNHYMAMEAAIREDNKQTLIAIQAICKVTLRAVEPILEMIK
jgi:hypothetical protein